ncbi:MAG: hypothetical protein GTO55_10615 [Armatimonadetes bacterium]|nr:hypothetical protein [Armatimonadota bacterium]NIM68564.1 hypothetical protein [Armatimonadota bacterium]NIN06759.1 hypothetical protein [Armatimonadota bacterium]
MKELLPNLLSRLIRQIGRTTQDEISCDDCFRSLDEFAEVVAQGGDASKLLPKIQQHLDLCGDCREEFQALLRVLEADSD